MAMFQRNGRSGYILKPQILREEGDDLLNAHTKHMLDVTVRISVLLVLRPLTHCFQVISAQQLPSLRGNTGEEKEQPITDPFVQVTLYIPDWSHLVPPSTFVIKEKFKSSRIVTQRTQVVKQNGFDPIWAEKLSFPFDCVGGAAIRDLIFVEFSVKQESG